MNCDFVPFLETNPVLSVLKIKVSQVLVLACNYTSTDYSAYLFLEDLKFVKRIRGAERSNYFDYSDCPCVASIKRFGP